MDFTWRYYLCLLLYVCVYIYMCHRYLCNYSYTYIYIIHTYISISIYVYVCLLPYHTMPSYVLQATSAAQATLPVARRVPSEPLTPRLAWLSATSATRDISGGTASLHAPHVPRHMCQKMIGLGATRYLCVGYKRGC